MTLFVIDHLLCYCGYAEILNLLYNYKVAVTQNCELTNAPTDGMTLDRATKPKPR